MPSAFPQAAVRPGRLAAYPSGEELVNRFRKAARRAGGHESTAGMSVEGRALWRFDLGTPGRKVVLLTALMHGVEAIGALALLDVIEQLGHATPLAASLLENAHLVVLPIVNPDAFFSNMNKVAAGKRAWQRCNAHGVDLNRNFPRLTTKGTFHPLSGSRFRASPHYVGPHSLSEPESRAIHAVAVTTRPALSLAFHSFGDLLLYPWTYTARENERTIDYLRLAAAMSGALGPFPYRVRQARHLYPILGDMDDWLDATLGTLAFTVEVSHPDLRISDGRNLLNPFCWMNPGRVEETVKNLTPGVLALLKRAVGLDSNKGETASAPTDPARGLEFAAK